MKQLIIASLIFMLLTGLNTASADDSIEAIEIVAGMVSGYAIHEAGHAVMGWATNTDMDWRSGDWRNPITFTTEHADRSRTAAIIHASGLTTGLLASEIILQSDGIDKRKQFIMGMMLYNVLNPILYSLDYWAIRGTNYSDDNACHGDIGCFERYTDHGTANAFAGGIALIAAIQGWRFLNAQIEQDQDQEKSWLEENGMRLNLMPVRNGGMLNLEIDF